LGLWSGGEVAEVFLPLSKSGEGFLEVGGEMANGFLGIINLQIGKRFFDGGFFPSEGLGGLFDRAIERGEPEKFREIL
jgi:hypothetical protein